MKVKALICSCGKPKRSSTFQLHARKFTSFIILLWAFKREFSFLLTCDNLDQSTKIIWRQNQISIKFTTCLNCTSSWSINQSVCVPELRCILDKSTTPSPLKSSSPKKSWSQMATRSLVSAMRDWSSWKENISLNTGLRVLDLYAVFFCPSPLLQEKETYNNYSHVLVCMGMLGVDPLMD